MPRAEVVGVLKECLSQCPFWVTGVLAQEIAAWHQDEVAAAVSAERIDCELLAADVARQHAGPFLHAKIHEAFAARAIARAGEGG